MRILQRVPVVLMLLAAGCGVGPSNPDALPVRVVQGSEGETLAVISVFLRDQGPFVFAIDTGASKSLIDSEVVTAVGLSVIGTSTDVVGVGGRVPADLIQVDDWNLNQQVRLTPTVVTGLDLPAPEHGRGLQGLLGSDVLSDFEVITLDYERGELLLGRR
jgi:hypothetical protein